MSVFRPVLSLTLLVAGLALLSAAGVRLSAARQRVLDERLALLEHELASQRAQLDALAAQLKALEPKQPSDARADPETMYAVPVGTAPVRSHDDAPVTIVEYVDFQCPFCARAQGTLDDVLRRYGTQVRVVFKHNPLPFHKRAMPAALAAECAEEQGRFWAMEQRLWRDTRALDDDDLAAHAEAVGLDLPRWRSCLESERARDAVERDLEEAARFGARGTPTFFINGRPLVGAQPLERFQQRIDEELRRVRESGLPAGRYYEEVVLERGADRVGDD